MNDRDDVLKRATEALRHDGEPDARDVARLRERLFADNVVPLRAPSKSRARALRWVLPLAAAFVAGSALAATPGAWDGVLHALERYLPYSLQPAERTAEHTPARPPKRESPPRKEAAQPLAAPESRAPAQVPPVGDAPDTSAHGASSAATVVVATAQPGTRRRPHAPRPLPAEPATVEDEPIARSSEAPPAQKVATPSADLVRFREAHTLQFRSKDYQAAVRAWDAYLRAAPDSPLALEARYHRALCYVRLARYRDAELALTPFAQGQEAAAYKRDEAAHILKALEKLP